MKKVFGIQAEINLTADEDVVKGIGKGIANGSVILDDIVKEIKPTLIKYLKNFILSKIPTTYAHVAETQDYDNMTIEKEAR